MNYVKFLRCSPDLYKAFQHKDEDTLYFVYEEDESTAELYLGNKLIAAADSTGGSATFLEALKDVFINDNLAHEDILTYDNILQTWVNKPLSAVQKTFIGTNGAAAGISGLVPGPAADDTNKFLKSDGSWSSIEVTKNVLSIDNEDNLSHAELIDQETENIKIEKGDIIIIQENEVPTTYVYNSASWTPVNKNLIVSVSEDFTIDSNKQLKINKIQIAQVEGLEEQLSSVGQSAWDTF